jgi:hypothetical protein
MKDSTHALGDLFGRAGCPALLLMHASLLADP